MRYEYEPSTEQRAIIEEPRLDIPLKVVAGAGSGKTFVLAHRFVWLVLNNEQIKPERILTLTFTNNAAAEMKLRIKRLLRLNGVAFTGELWVHTFHSFAVRLLRECSYQVGLSPEPQLLSELQQRLEFEQLVADVFAGDFSLDHALHPDRLAEMGFSRPNALRDLLVQLITYARSNGLNPDEFRKQAEELSDGFWAALPTAQEVARLENAKALAPDLQRRLAGIFPPEDLAQAPVNESGATLELRKLYYVDLKKATVHPDLDERLAREQEIERTILAAAEAACSLYQQRLAERDGIDFADQINKAADLLDNYLDIRDRYRQRFQYLLVDEFQDTSRAQMAMLQALARPARLEVEHAGQLRQVDSYRRLMVVGDQKQSIYGWRGARPENLDNLLPFGEGDLVSGTPLFRPLTVTYRMDRQLTVCANAAAQHARPQDPALTSPQEAAGTVISVAPFTAGDDETIRHARRREAAYIAEEIQQLVAEPGQFEYGDICVLMRKRDAFRYLKNAFEDRKIPYQALGGVGFFEHPLACDLLAFMRVVNDPFDDLSLVRLLTRPPVSMNDRQLFLLVSVPCEAEAEVATGMSLLPNQGSLPREEEHTAGSRRRRPEDRAIITALAELVAGEDSWRSSSERAELPVDRLRELYELIGRLRPASLLHPARTVFEMVLAAIPEAGMTPAERAAAPAVKATFTAIIEELGGGGVAVGLAELVRAVDLYEGESGLELPAPDIPVRNAVQVMTIHRAKGLGFPVVFVMAWDPHGLRRGSTVYDESCGLVGFTVDGKRSAKSIVCKLFTGGDKQLQEEERLWYVALTRAKHLVCVTYAAGKTGEVIIPWGEDLVGALEESGAELAERVTPGPGYGPGAPLLPARLPEDLQLARHPAVVRTSFSALRDVLVCPRRWWINHKWRIEELGEETGPATELAIGTCFHEYVAAHYRSRGRLDDAYLQALCDTVLAEAEADDLARLHKLIGAFRASPWAELAPPGQDVERAVHLVREVGEVIVAVSGRLDLVVAARGRFADFKTNRRLGERQLEDYALQMLIYREALAAEHAEGSDWQPVLVHVTPEGLKDMPLDEALLARQEQRLEQALTELVELEWSGQWPDCPPGAPCGSCDYAQLCHREGDGSD